MDETRQDACQPISVDNAPRPNTCGRFPIWRWLARVAVALLITLAMAENLHTSWQRWGDVVIDCGRELDTPRQLAAGATLYKDVRYWYGPLPPYLNAVLFRIFGVHLSVITTAGMVVTALTAWLTYRLVRQFAARAPAAAAAVAFLYVSAFGHYLTVNIFNFVLPYACPATYGMLLAIASVYFLIRHAARQRNRNLILSCVFLSLTALCKIEVLVAVAVPHVVFLMAWLLAGRLRRRIYLVSYAAAIAVPVAVFGYFYAHTGNELLADNLFLPGNVAASAFTLEHTGFDQPTESLKAVGIGSAALAGCLVVLGVAAFAERRIRRDPSYDASMRILALGAIAVGAALLCAGVCYLLEAPTHAFRGTPVLLLVVFGVLAIRFCFAGRQDRAAQVPALLLYAFGLAAIARMLLRCGAMHYGFYLLVPALAAFATCWCRHVPAAFGGASGRRSLPAAVGGVAILIMLAYTHGTASRRTSELVYGAEPAAIKTPRGAMVLPHRYVGAVDEAIRYLHAQPPETTVVVVPEGVGITFLAGCVNPLGVHTYLPLDFSGAYDNERMTDRVAQADPDYVLLTARDTSEYGARMFGVDYAQPMAKWISASRAVAKDFRSPQYGVRIWRREPK